VFESAATAVAREPPAIETACRRQLRWHGMAIPVPVLNYDHIGLNSKRNTFMLVTADSFGIFTDPLRSRQRQRATTATKTVGPGHHAGPGHRLRQHHHAG